MALINTTRHAAYAAMWELMMGWDKSARISLFGPQVDLNEIEQAATKLAALCREIQEERNNGRQDTR